MLNGLNALKPAEDPPCRSVSPLKKPLMDSCKLALTAVEAEDSLLLFVWCLSCAMSYHSVFANDLTLDVLSIIVEA